MKKYLIPLVVAAMAVVHAQAADLSSQLLGYWTIDAAQTKKVAEKANREIDGLKLMFMEKKMVYEFQKDQMIIHVASPDKVPAMPYTVKAVDEKTKSLTLDLGGEKEMKIRLDKGKMAHNDPDDGWMVFNPMSKEDFAIFAKAAENAGGKVTPEPEGSEKAPAAQKLEDVSAQHIPDKSANGKINGEDFIVEKATFSDGELTLWQSGAEPKKDDRKFSIFGFKDKVDSKKFSMKPGQDATGLSAVLRYRKEGEDFAVPATYLNGYSLKLEFGTAKDGKIPGKIHLRLPDEERSFVIGSFEAEIK
jgi:hypothetical protein